MTPTYLVDTDWVIHYLNGRQDITERLEALKHEGLGLSVVSLAELYEGVYYSRDPEGDEQGLNDFLQGVTLIGLDEETAKIFGHERGRLRATGMIIGDLDLLIGATALQYNLTLLTNKGVTLTLTMDSLSVFTQRNHLTRQCYRPFVGLDE